MVTYIIRCGEIQAAQAHITTRPPSAPYKVMVDNIRLVFISPGPSLTFVHECDLFLPNPGCSNGKMFHKTQSSRHQIFYTLYFK